MASRGRRNARQKGSPQPSFSKSPVASRGSPVSWVLEHLHESLLLGPRFRAVVVPPRHQRRGRDHDRLHSPPRQPKLDAFAPVSRRRRRCESSRARSRNTPAQHRHAASRPWHRRGSGLDSLRPWAREPITFLPSRETLRHWQNTRQRGSASNGGTPRPTDAS